MSIKHYWDFSNIDYKSPLNPNIFGFIEQHFTIAVKTLTRKITIITSNTYLFFQKYNTKLIIKEESHTVNFRSINSNLNIQNICDSFFFIHPWHIYIQQVTLKRYI